LDKRKSNEKKFNAQLTKALLALSDFEDEMRKLDLEVK